MAGAETITLCSSSDCSSHRLDEVAKRNAVMCLGALTLYTCAAFEMIGADVTLKDARKVWSWIQRERKPIFTFRDCFKLTRNHGTSHPQSYMPNPQNHGANAPAPSSADIGWAPFLASRARLRAGKNRARFLTESFRPTPRAGLSDTRAPWPPDGRIPRHADSPSQ
jgi:hypothetical protein